MNKPTTYEEGNQNKKALAIEAYRQALRMFWEIQIEIMAQIENDCDWQSIIVPYNEAKKNKNTKRLRLWDYLPSAQIGIITEDERNKFKQEQAND